MTFGPKIVKNRLGCTVIFWEIHLSEMKGTPGPDFADSVGYDIFF